MLLRARAGMASVTRLYFGGKHGATVQMGACALSQVATTARAEVRAASERIGGQFRHPEAQVTAQAVGGSMPGAVDEEQGALFRGQHAGALAVQVGQTAVGRLDDVGERDRLGALRALHLHVTPRSPVSIRCPGRVTSRPGVRSRTPLGETPAASTRALNGEWRRGEYHGKRAAYSKYVTSGIGA